MSQQQPDPNAYQQQGQPYQQPGQTYPGQGQPYQQGEPDPQLLAQVLVSTMNDVPGYRVVRVYGEVFGLTVRSRNIGSQFGAGLKALAGGELKGMTKNLVDSRHQVMGRMVQEAVNRGANAVLAMRFDTSEMGNTWTEICAYGTAVSVVPE